MDKIELLEPLKLVLKSKGKKGEHITRIVRELTEGDLISESLPTDTIRTLAKELLDEQSKRNGEFERVPKVGGGIKSGYYRIRVQKEIKPVLPQSQTVPDGEDVEELTRNTQFFGKAGEYAVMAELLFRDFNANNMTVDEGIDIIASKDNNFYFVQVKTTTLKQNKTAIVQIQQKNFDKFINQQMRYVVVIKYDKGMKFFTLTNSAIEQLKYYKALSVSEITGNISIKIRFDEKMTTSVFYDKQECDAGFYEGFKRMEV